MPPPVEQRADGHPAKAEVARALAAHRGASKHAGNVVLSTAVGDVIRQARADLAPGRACVVDTETSDLDGIVVEMAKILRAHITQFGTGTDGRLFTGIRGGELAEITIRRAWAAARTSALTEAEQKSPLAKRVYDLRHACLSLWLNAGVAPTQAAAWAGHSVDVLLRVYAKCIDGQDAIAKRRITEALREDAPDMLPPITETDTDTNEHQDQDCEGDEQP